MRPIPTPHTPRLGVHQVGPRRLLVTPRLVRPAGSLPVVPGLAVELLPPGSRQGRTVAVHTPGSGLRLTGNALDGPAAVCDAVRSLFGLSTTRVA